ncbi:MAG TPA: hypothetical protein VNM69_14695 [Bacillus sp. (in: firmicutes)]|nr:hypothetical protein [Bacillus sp. (in: firmicutes)]
MYGLQLIITLILAVIVIWNMVLIIHPFQRKKLGVKIFPKGARAGKGIKQIRSTDSFQYKIGQVFLYFYTPISIYTIFYSDFNGKLGVSRLWAHYGGCFASILYDVF